MNTKQKIGVVTLVASALAISYWTGYIHGSSVLHLRDKIASVALPIILIWTLAKLTFAFFFRGGSIPPSQGGSQPGMPSPISPMPKSPGSPEICCEHGA